MPSTRSRKPGTKCWRACSPSLTMSMPASSCALIASRVASRLASSSASPSSRQGAHSLLVSASQPGFGRLPAMVVSNILPPELDAASLRRQSGGYYNGEMAVLKPFGRLAAVGRLPSEDGSMFAPAEAVLFLDDAHR